MLNERAVEVVRTLRDEGQLQTFAARLAEWLIEELGPDDQPAPAFTESRAKALLRAGDTIDDATLQGFDSLAENDLSRRVALYDLLESSNLADNAEVAAMAHMPSVEDHSLIPWLALATAAYAWLSGYPIHQLDPASPPDPYSPAGQVLKRAVQFLRRQLQRSASERDKVGRLLSQPPSGTPSLEELAPSETEVAPLPPHYRPPIPERYPEIASETLQIDPDDSEPDPRITVGRPLVITEEELQEPDDLPSEPVRMPPITISPEQLPSEAPASPPSPMPATAVVMPTSTTQPRPSFSVALRQMLGQEELTSTKLRVQVQQFPDGPGVYGLQVRVRCKGIKSYVAGTTDREGKFLCELPVRMNSGLTYDVEVTWPRDDGGEVERKSITLNADRTHFTLPFYRQSGSPEASE